MSGVARIYRRNPLAFPGRQPGFDPSHPASNGIAGINGFSVVSGGLASLAYSHKPTVNSATFGNSLMGPASLLTGATSQNVSFSSSTVFAASGTMAAIFSTTNASGDICANDSSTAGGGIVLRGTGLTLNDVIAVSHGLTVPTEVPLFYAASKNGSIYSFVLLNLANGQIQTATASHSNTGRTPSSGTAVIGAQTGAASIQGSLACAMFAPAGMSLNSMLLWAADPWAFWYPLRVENLIFSSLKGPSSQSASFNLVAVSSMGAVGALKPSIAKTLGTTAATSAVENLKPTDQRVLSGVAVTAAVAGLKPSVNKPLSAVAAVGAVEALSRQDQRSLTGVAATSAAEGLKAGIGKVLGTAVSTAAVAALAPKISKSFGDAAAVGAVGSFTVTAGAAVSLAAAAATGNVGTLLSSIRINLAGAQAAGEAEPFGFPVPPSAGGSRQPDTVAFGSFSHMGHRR